MQRSLRALTAAFAIAIASLAGALYLGHSRATHAPDGISVAALDVSSLLANPETVDRRMVDVAFRQLQQTYYKPFSDQTVLTGEAHALTAALKKLHAAHPVITAFTADGDPEHDLGAAERTLDAARARIDKAPDTETTLTQAALSGMLASLGDPYTVYLSPKEIGALEESLKGGDFGGIGVYIVQDPRNKHILVDPIEGTPAAKAGIKIGDRIVAVDGEPTSSLSLDQVERRIRGPIGTAVNLRIRPQHGAAKTVAVTRRQILVPSVHAQIKDDIDYVRLGEFGSTSYDEVRRALLAGKAKHVRGYILDLRNNGGGLLDAAVQISSLFIPDGTIVSTVDRAGDRDVKDALHTSLGRLTPLVLLVNKYTASASEITAGAVQDDHVGTLIGTKTFGKGVVQSIDTLSDGGALKITTARYLTPAGRDIQHKGILPDIVVDQSVDAPIIDTPADEQLAAAKHFIRSHAAPRKNGST